MITHVPSVTFRLRVRDDSLLGDNPYRWEELTSEELFGNKKTLIFSLPGAFTPTCSTYQLPNFEKLYPQFRELGIDDIYCMSVNDAFVMNAWGRHQDLENVKLLPDGTAQFTRHMGMLVDKSNIGFGYRSWRYAVLVDNMEIVQSWVEPGLRDNAEDDPYGETDPHNILASLT